MGDFIQTPNSISAFVYTGMPTGRGTLPSSGYFGIDAGLAYSAAAISQTQVLVSFTTPITTINTTASRYTITGPSSITVSSVIQSSSTQLTLTVTGSWSGSGTYSLAILNNTIGDATGKFNQGVATFLGPSSAGILPLTPPTVSNVNPVPGTAIYINQPISFDVKDDTGLRRVIITAKYQRAKIQEVVHDGYDFGFSYLGSSNVISSISGGFHYVMLRDGGWPEGPILTTFAVDTSGTENV